jgi:hypothetical protein
MVHNNVWKFEKIWLSSTLIIIQKPKEWRTNGHEDHYIPPTLVERWYTNNNITSDKFNASGGHHGHDHMVVGFTTTYAIRGLGLGLWCLMHFQQKQSLTNPIQSVHIITKGESLNPAHGQVCAIQHYVIKFVIDLRQVIGYLWVLWFPPPIKRTPTK